MKNKGFTLVELLAVIVVLGIILVIAIPNVLGIIEQARSDSFANTAKVIIRAAKNKTMTNPEYLPVANNTAKVMPLSVIDIDNMAKDVDSGSYDQAKSYVLIRNNNGNYEYYVTLVGSKRVVDLNNETNITVTNGTTATPVPTVGSTPITGVTVDYIKPVYLSNLVVTNSAAKPVGLTPVFGVNTYSYTASVLNTITTVTITPTILVPADADIRVNGTLVTSGTASGPITLVVGPNTINVDVTSKATNENFRYTITVTRA